MRLISVLSFLIFASTLMAENWPGWRGPRGDGTSLEKKIPTKWSAKENIAWKRAIPGKGHASPIIWGDRVFVATAAGNPEEASLKPGLYGDVGGRRGSGMAAVREESSGVKPEHI